MQAHSLSSRAAGLDVLGYGPVGLAHDAGNLLNALGLYCDLLESPEVLRAEHRHYVVELRGVAKRIGELVGFDKSFVCNGDFSEVVSFEPVLERICGPESHFVLEVGRNLPPVSVGVDVVERILLNLVRNAAEAIARQRSSGGEVKATLVGEGDSLVLTVEDNGPGVDLWAAGKFLRPSGDVVRGERGVGHRILYELARESGAVVEMRVRPGRGSSFRFAWSSERKQEKKGRARKEC